ncbi:MAG: tetratricopeptide (TPR) repeat protein [Marivirga sp.]|jgi:tetratricopeptide (TPR) repeat protein
MKRITLFIALVLSSVLTYAQNANVRKAESALETGALQEAMKLIDEASKHEKTFDDGKTWYVRGTVYQAATKENYQDNFLKEAVASFKKVQELEKEGSNYHTLSDLKIQEIWGGYINKGSEAYGASSYEEAVSAFRKALLVLPDDTTATLYAGISSQQAKDNGTALKYYYRLIDLDYQSEDIYGSIISIERYENQDLEKALEMVAMAKEMFPDVDAFEKQEINLLIAAERVDEAKDRINDAIAKEPNNANLYFNLGYMFEELEQPEEAEKAYLKAIELDPEYLDANFNYAVFNYNIAADMYSKTKDMDLKTYQKEGKKIEKEARIYLNKSLPYFEKAMEMAPGELAILETLQIVYSQLGMDDKAIETLDKIDALKVKSEKSDN